MATDRATVFQTVQIGPETTPGTAVAALKRLQGMSFDTAMKPDVQFFRPSGYKFDTVSVLNREWVEASVTGIPSYNELQYGFCSVLKNATPSLLATQTQQWVFQPNSNGPDTMKTYTIQQGSPTPRAHSFAYALFTEFGLEFSRSGVGLKGSVLGQALTDNAQMSTNEVSQIAITGSPTGGSFTVTANGITTGAIPYNSIASAVQTIFDTAFGAGNSLITGGPLPGTAIQIEWRGIYGAQDITAPTTTNSFTGGTSPNTTITTPTPGVSATALPFIPIAAPDVAVFIASTQAGLAGATMLQRCTKAEWSIGDRQNPIWALNRSLSFPGTVETVPKMMAKLKMEADSEGMQFLTNVRANTDLWIRIEALGGLIESGQNYLCRIDMAARISEPSKFEDEDGLYGIEWTFNGAHNSTSGYATQVTLKNTQSAL